MMSYGHLGMTDHRFHREDDGEVIWYTGKVSSYDVATDLCTIIYDYEIDDDDDCIDEDEDDEPNNVFEEPLSIMMSYGHLGMTVIAAMVISFTPVNYDLQKKYNLQEI
jgi:hypothetical protein